MTYISLSSDFVLYLKDYLMDSCCTWDTDTIYVGQWPIFYVPVILPYILKTIWWTNRNIRSMWCKDLPHKMYVGQWPTFHCPVILSYIIKTIWWIMLYLRYWFSVTQTLNWNYISKLVTYIPGPVILPYILKKYHNWKYRIHVMQRFTTWNVCGSVIYIS